MAGYWPSSFFASLWTETESRSINTQKKNEDLLLDLLLSNSFPQYSNYKTEEFCKGYAPQLNFHFDKVGEETRWFDMF